MAAILEIFRAALAAVDPRPLVARELRRLDGGALDPRRFRRVVVAAAGKAAAGMGLAAEEFLGARILSGVLALPRGEKHCFRAMTPIVAGHPLPDEGSERAARAVLALLEAADAGTLVLFLLSGGASALLAAPAAGMALADKRAATERLLRAGAAIAELNAVRKHLSAVKGGRLAAAAHPAAVLTLALSDVPGDDPCVIGSGPTAADPTTFADALAAIERHGGRAGFPDRALAVLERGAGGGAEETPKPGDPRLARAELRIIGGNGTALAAAAGKAAALGWAADVAAVPLRGEAREAGRRLAGEALRAQAVLAPGGRRCLLSGGETTVLVRGSGRGGRNQELALAFASAVAGRPGIVLLSAGTDGCDGPTEAAGAVVDGATVPRASALGLDAAAFLERNDSHSFFSELERRAGGRAILRTGPTGTNVADLQAILVSRPGGCRGGNG
jgi:glycerate-2-kinase